jgi:hypothetical protein
MMIKYIAKGIVKGVDEWADSLTQEQFNTRMAGLLLVIFLVGFGIVGHLDYLDTIQLNVGD